MFGKLIKHEFKATARRLVPMIILLLGMAFIAGLVLPALSESAFAGKPVFRTLYTIGWIVYGASYVVVAVVALVLLIERFNSHVLGKEGYLTMTLPVSAHEILWSKMIVLYVWFAVISAVVAFVIAATLRVEPYQLARLAADVKEFFRSETFFSVFDFILFAAEGLIFTFVAFSATLLQIYACLMIGQQFGKYKIALAVIFYVISSSACSFIGVLALMLLDTDFISVERLMDFGWKTHYHPFVLAVIAATAVPGIIFYLITAYGMRKRLNLE